MSATAPALLTTLFSGGLVVLFVLYHVLTWPRPGKSQEAKEEHAPDTTLTVSFLVPAWNAAADLPRFLAAFEALRYPRKELILCVGGDDGGLEIARAAAEASERNASARVVVLEQQPGEGKQRALRRSLPLARGELIYLTDIDCQPTDAAVEPLIERLHQGAAAATGPICPLPEQRSKPFVRMQWAIERLTSGRGGESSSGLRGANAALTRAALRRSGDFAQDAPSGTDYTLAKELARHGLSIAFVPASEMPTRFPDDVATYVRKQARWLRNVVVLGARYGEWGEVRSVMLTLAIPFVLAALLVLGFRFPAAWLLGVLLVAHAVLNRLRYAVLSDLAVPPLTALSSVFADLGAGLLATSQLLRRRFTWS